MYLDIIMPPVSLDRCILLTWHPVPTNRRPGGPASAITQPCGTDRCAILLKAPTSAATTFTSHGLAQARLGSDACHIRYVTIRQFRFLICTHYIAYFRVAIFVYSLAFKCLIFLDSVGILFLTLTCIGHIDMFVNKQSTIFKASLLSIVLVFRTLVLSSFRRRHANHQYND